MKVKRFLGLAWLALSSQISYAQCNEAVSPVEIVRDVAALEFKSQYGPGWLHFAHLRCPFTGEEQLQDFLRDLCLDCEASFSRTEAYEGRLTHPRMAFLSESITENTLSLAVKSMGGSDWQLINYELDSEPEELGAALFSFEKRQLIRLWVHPR